jgi:hypothetical protein
MAYHFYLTPNGSDWPPGGPLSQPGMRLEITPSAHHQTLPGRPRGRVNAEYGFGTMRPALVDLACIAGLATDRMSGFEMIGLVEQLTYQGCWVVLVFHDIDGARLTVGSHDFNMLLDYL